MTNGDMLLEVMKHKKKNMAMRNMIVFRSTETDAKINLVDMSLKEVRLQFRTEASIGVGNGMLYCNAVEVIDTQITDAPPEVLNSYTKRLCKWLRNV